MLASNIGAGFIGGILAAFSRGTRRRRSPPLKLPASVESLKPILIIPLLADLLTGLVMIYVIARRWPVSSMR